MKNKEAEAELLKMLFIVREIRASMETLVAGTLNNQTISQSIMEAYTEELETIMSQLRRLDQGQRRMSQGVKNYRGTCAPSLEHQRLIRETISQSQEDEDRSLIPNESPSKAFQIRIKDRDGKAGARLSIDQLVQLNHQLYEQNEYLERKLRQAESYIRKLQSMYQTVQRDVEELKIKHPPRVDYERDPVFFKLNVQIERLKGELHETSEFIVRNNQEFVDEIQRYNESIWKLQNQIQNLKGAMDQAYLIIGEQQRSIDRVKGSALEPGSTIRQRACSKDPTGYEFEEQGESQASRSWLNKYLTLKDPNKATLNVRRKASPSPTSRFRE